jgi:hypothetical protein
MRALSADSAPPLRDQLLGLSIAVSLPGVFDPNAANALYAAPLGALELLSDLLFWSQLMPGLPAHEINLNGRKFVSTKSRTKSVQVLLMRITAYIEAQTVDDQGLARDLLFHFTITREYEN